MGEAVLLIALEIRMIFEGTRRMVRMDRAEGGSVADGKDVEGEMD